MNLRRMRRPKGAGTVVRIRGKYHARWRIDGENVYGPQRDSQDQAELDRINARPIEGATVQKTEIPTLQHWAYTCNNGRYGKKIPATTLVTNETIRLKHVEGSALGRKRIDRITRKECQAYVDDLKGSPAWIRRIAAYVSKLFSLARSEGFIRQSPMERIDLPEVSERENRVLAPSEAMRLLNASRPLDVLLLAAMTTGMRRAELQRLEWKHVDEEWVKVPGTKTKHSKAKVPMAPELWSALKQLERKGAYVFHRKDGQMLGLRYITRATAKRMLELGLPKETRLQDLRGSFVSLLLETGADVRTVQELARHSDPRTTLKMYARSRTEVKQKAVKNLVKTIAGTSRKGKRRVSSKGQH